MIPDIRVDEIIAPHAQVLSEYLVEFGQHLEEEKEDSDMSAKHYLVGIIDDVHKEEIY